MEQPSGVCACVRPRTVKRLWRCRGRRSSRRRSAALASPPRGATDRLAARSGGRSASRHAPSQQRAHTHTPHTRRTAHTRHHTRPLRQCGTRKVCGIIQRPRWDAAVKERVEPGLFDLFLEAAGAPTPAPSWPTDCICTSITSGQDSPISHVSHPARAMSQSSRQHVRP